MIKRDYYLNQLIDGIDNGLIKIITGIRRCGKSFLLFKIFKQYLLDQNVDENHIIEIQLDRRSFSKLTDPDELYKYVIKRVVDNRKYYLFIDEIQMCEDFVHLLNAFFYIDNIDVYVTGSNSHLLSKDVITEFRGRGDEIRLNPLSFKEFYSQRSDFEEAWKEYYTFGGMPLILAKKDSNQKMQYLKDLFSETYLKDIKERNKIVNDKILDEILNIIASSIGSLINVQKLVNTFKSVLNISVSPNTIKEYLTYLEDSFIVRKSMRYDIKGKKYISTPSKYYFTDVGLRNARLNFRQQEESHLMENIIYNELCLRGYSVDVGVITLNEKTPNGNYTKKQLECNFVINKGDARIYIQTTYSISDEDKKIQEKRPLININDSFKKIIIVKDNIRKTIDDNGIIIVSLKDFLLDDTILNF